LCGIRVAILMDNAEFEFCEKCQRHLAPGDSGIVWDDRRLCDACFASDFDAEFGEQAIRPQEMIRVDFGAALMRGLLSAVFTTTIVVGMLFLLFLLIRFAFQLSEIAVGKPLAPPDLKVWLLFLGVGFCFCSIISLPLVVGWSLTSRTRRIHVEDGQLIQKTWLGTVKIPLEKGTWYQCPKGYEGARGLLWRRPLVGIHHRENAQLAVVCGFTDQARRLWTGYFTRMVHRPVAVIPRMRLFINGVRGLLLGGAAGLVAGGTVHALTGKPMWITALTFLGFLDGLAWAFIDSAFRFGALRSVTEYFESNRKVLPISMIGTSALLGLKIGILVGFPGAIAGSLANACAGALGWIWIRSQIQKRASSKPAESDPSVGEPNDS